MIARIKRLLARYAAVPARLNRIQEALGRIESRQVALAPSGAVAQEFRVFSQWGEDGIIQHLIRHVPTPRKIFVEFGVENYLESNTRFLLTNDAWSGLVMDGSRENIDFIRRDPIYWASNLKAEHCFITAENIDEVLKLAGVQGDIGLLSIDIDGNDYWVWQSINSVHARIVVCEYNSHFGPHARVSVPYDPAFVRDTAHFSKVYYGASISALTALAHSKGYSLVAANSAGNNLFFVRNDVKQDLRTLSCDEAYRRAVFREYHDAAGRLTFDDFETRVRNIAGLPVHDFSSNSVRRIGEALDVDSD